MRIPKYRTKDMDGSYGLTSQRTSAFGWAALVRDANAHTW